MRDEALCAEVIDFWYLLELFNQKPLPAVSKKESRSALQAAKSSKPPLIVDLIHSFESFEQLSISAMLLKDKALYEKYNAFSSNFSISVGQVSRTEFYEKLRNLLHLSDENDPERIKECSLACFAFSMDSQGCYIDGSLSVSPVLWAVGVLEHGLIDDIYSRRKYVDYCAYIEKILTKENSISLKPEHVQSAFQKIVSSVKGISSLQSSIVVSYKRSPVQDVDLSSQDYLLPTSYLLNDLALVKRILKENKGSGNLSALIEYVLAPFYFHEAEAEEGNCQKKQLVVSRIDSDQDIAKFTDLTQHVKDLPKGKWPSKYRPALMQQAAINLFLNTTRDGEIFSVNGPPGTGKTTLLKEVIADYVVRRASLLANILGDDGKPDDAYESEVFHDGKGAKDHGYSFWYSKYAKFKNPELAKYGILVVSSNNNAVENITKELPDAKLLLGALEDEQNDGLQEIHDLFASDEDALESEQTVSDCFSEEDIFFTQYAKALFSEDFAGDNTSQKAEAWGLISAPLGKRSNIKKYAEKVLVPLMKCCKNTSIEDRLEKKLFSSAVKRFCEQLKVVETLQGELQKNCDLLTNVLSLEGEKKRIQAECDILNRDLEDHQLIYHVKRNDLLVKRKEYEDRESFLDQRIASEKRDLGVLEKRRKEGEKERDIDIERLKRYSGIKRFFTSKEERQKIEKHLDECIEAIDECKSEEKKKNTEMHELTQELNASRDSVNDIVMQMQEEDAKVYYRKSALRECEQKLESTLKVSQEALRQYILMCEGSKIDVCDKAFISRLLSNDSDERARAHISNLWTTQTFDRAREKLFYLALQVHKEFVLGSKLLRNNIKNLLIMWGIEKTRLENKGAMVSVKFSDRDKRNSFPHLLNSLMLITPVISTTFASVERFLSDNQVPGSMGLLIVDEAGQAQPQYALGSLLRSSKALIVGDPRQVVPVVTNEMDIFRKRVTKDHLRPYRAKELSVQWCADYVNEYGTFLRDPQDENDEWIGFPLIVHRRCIDPMFSISNALSYDNTMCNMAKLPDGLLEKSFVLDKSSWINITGSEIGNKNHYIKNQGEKVLSLVRLSFEKAQYADIPSIFVISPFSSVAEGLRGTVKNSSWYKQMDVGSKKLINKWLVDNVGTVHSFQGKEANEVFLLLGCDGQSKSVVQWVNPNIVNVAVTRAKYRLCVIGDYRLWKENKHLRLVKKHLDTYSFGCMLALDPANEMYEQQLLNYAQESPGAESFIIEDDGEWVFADDSFLDNLRDIDLPDLTENDFKRFRIGEEELSDMSSSVRKNIEYGIKLYKLYAPLREQAEDLDMSCCTILFCKAFEGHLNHCLKRKLSDLTGDKAFQDGKKVMMGKYASLFIEKRGKLQEIADSLKEKDFDWCRAYGIKLNEFKDERNNCCHPSVFSWDSMAHALGLLFIKGLIKETSYIGKNLEIKPSV